MKRHRQANRAIVEPSERPAAQSLSATGVWAKTAASTPAIRASSDADGRVWARYIDSRMKQFGTR